MQVPLQGLDACAGLVVPHLYGFVVGAGQQVGAVTAREVLYTVDALFVTVEGEVGDGNAEGPYLGGG